MGRSSHLGSQYHLAEQLHVNVSFNYRNGMGGVFKVPASDLVHIPAHREQPFRLNVNTYSVST